MSAPAALDRLGDVVTAAGGAVVTVREKDRGRAAVAALMHAPAGPVVVGRRLDPDVQAALTKARLTLLPDDAPDPGTLTAAPAVVVQAELAVAETGEVVLVHTPGLGRRAGVLLPPWQICLVRASDVVSSLEEALARLEPALTAGSPVTWVHGPGPLPREDPDDPDDPPERTLHVVVVR